MPERAVTICNELGFHARAASRFVETAGRFRSKISIAFERSIVDGKSILGILTLAAPIGSRLLLRAEGPDADEALASLSALIEGRFGEER